VQRKRDIRAFHYTLCVDIYIFFVFSLSLYVCVAKETSHARFRIMQRRTLHSATSADFTWRTGVGRFIDTHHIASDHAPHLTPARNLQRRRVDITSAVLREPDIGTPVQSELKRNQ